MIFQSVFNFFGLLALSIMLHELGHLTYLWLLHKPAVMHYKLGGDIEIGISDDLTPSQYGNVLKAGIFIGVIPIVLGIIFLMNDTLSTFLVIASGAIYFFYGVKSDLQELKKIKRMNDGVSA